MTENLFTPNCIRTYTGLYFNVLDPKPEQIELEDIAHSLSMQPRFGGHLPVFYSVAQHCIECAKLLPRMDVLMHDSSKPYLIDVPRPAKLLLANYKELEDRIMNVIAGKFGFAWPMAEGVRNVDEQMLRLEWENIMLTDKWHYKCMTQPQAKAAFLRWARELGAV